MTFTSARSPPSGVVDWLFGWRMFAKECAEGHVTQAQYKQWWDASWGGRSVLGLVESMLAAGLTPSIGAMGDEKAVLQ